METYKGDNGKTYDNGFDYAMDRTRYNKPIDPITHTGTINTSPCWNDWIKLVEGNKKIFVDMEQDDIDGLFQFYDLGFQSGMCLGMQMGKGMRG